MMTIGDHPQYLALGYLLNQNMLRPDDEVTGIEHDEELEVVVVRTARPDRLRGQAAEEGPHLRLRAGHRVRRPDGAVRPGAAAGQRRVRTSWLYSLGRQINTTRSLYLKAGAIHGCCLCEEDQLILYWRMSAGTTRSTRSPATCSGTGWGRRAQLLHHRPADLGDGDQDGADGHPDPDLALRVHRLGGGAGAQGQPDADRSRPGEAVPGAGGDGADRVRRRPASPARRGAAVRAQGRRRGD